MNAVNILRFIKGYVVFTGIGGFTERFINLCSLSGILIWDVSFSEGKLSAKCRSSDYRKLRSISRKSGVKISFQSRHGIFSELQKRNQRKGLLVGALFFVIYFAFMSNFIWSINAENTDAYPKEDLLTAAEKEGLKIGTYKPLFDETAAANRIAQSNTDKLSWAAINIKGSRAVIEVREQKKSIKETVASPPCNIVSDSDGVIISAEVFSGIGNVTSGIAVQKGDLLISGALLNEDFSVSFIEAKGRITAERTKNFSMKFRKNVNVSTFVDTEKYVILNLFGLDFKVKGVFKKDKQSFTESDILSYNEVTLPLKYTVKTIYSTEKAKRSEAEFFLSAVEEFSNESYKLNKNTLLLSESFSVNQSEDTLFFSNNWKCIDFIGQKQEIIIEN